MFNLFFSGSSKQSPTLNFLLQNDGLECKPFYDFKCVCSKICMYKIYIHIKYTYIHIYIYLSFYVIFFISFAEI